MGGKWFITEASKIKLFFAQEQSEDKSEEELQKELGYKLSDLEIKRANLIFELLSCWLWK